MQDQLRDRNGRQRGTEAETDSEQRVQQKREKAAELKQLEGRSRARVQALLFTPTPETSAQTSVPASVPASQRQLQDQRCTSLGQAIGHRRYQCWRWTTSRLLLQT